MASLYKLRPDVFIQRAPGKLRIHRNKDNYILSLGNEQIDFILDFLEKADGANCIDTIIEIYPEHTRKSLRQIAKFLVSKDLAFLQDNSHAIGTPELEMVERYLSQFTDKTLLAHRSFSEQHVLLIADDITLLALLRTLAELGAEHVSFAISNQSSLLNSEQLTRAFTDNAVSPQSSVEEVSLCGLNGCNHYDVIVGTEPAILTQLSDQDVQNHYYAQFTAEHVILSKVPVTYQATPFSPTKTQRLIAGSVIGATLFDDLTGVRSFGKQDYAYYSLDATGILRFAAQQPVIALCTNQPAIKEPIDIVADFPTLSNAPLFPIISCEPQAHEIDLINIQKVTIQHQAGPKLISSSYYGIAFEEHDARIDALESFVRAEKKWLANDVNYPFISDRLAQQSHPVTLRLASSNAGICNVEFSKQAEFLRFCIKTVFCLDPVLTITDVEGKRVLQVRAGEHSVYGTWRSEKDQQLQRLLLRLYLNIWLAKSRCHVIADEKVAATPLLLTREACDEQSKTTSIA